MGKFLERFKSGSKKVDERVNRLAQRRQNRPRHIPGGRIGEQRTQNIGKAMYSEEENFEEEMDNDSFEGEETSESNNYDVDDYEANIQSAQKPESFHHFILENKFKDNEKSIRGYKDVFNKKTQKWEVKRKEIHCFTDEEAESIVRMAQVHLGTDIKLARMSLEAFGIMMDLLYDEFERYFTTIMEYRYGRYNNFSKDGKFISLNYSRQSKMKHENLKILVELYNAIWANYSRSVGGKENMLTHDSVRGQESLQGGRDLEYSDNTRGFQ